MKNTKSTKTNTIILDNQHNDIPGNPSTAKSSNIRLRTEATEDTLRALTLEQWNFWKENGYVVIKNVVPLEQVAKTLLSFGNLKVNFRMIKTLGIPLLVPK